MSERIKHTPFNATLLTQGVSRGRHIIEKGPVPADWLTDLKHRVEIGYNYDPALDQPTEEALPKELQPKPFGITEAIIFLREEHEHAPPPRHWHAGDWRKMKDPPPSSSSPSSPKLPQAA